MHVLLCAAAVWTGRQHTSINHRVAAPPCAGVDARVKYKTNATPCLCAAGFLCV